MAGTRATCVVPQVVIRTPPPSKPAPVQNPPSPPDFYSMLNLCNTAKAFPGTSTDHTRFLGTISWQFADQADFPVLADQKGLFDALSTILPLLNRQADADSGDIKAFFALANAIVQLELNCQEAQRQRDLQEVIFPLVLYSSV
ncbi:hypothetical protein C0993_010617 [Termitomyces sp. T159_Od127]|nr:hypothetical protein C0993_010617 [Termitomyces sp. T159_Od127]